MKRVYWDWRGNRYDGDEPLGTLCERCGERPAIRNPCGAEGVAGRTHWHGAVHVPQPGGGFVLMALCRECSPWR